MLALFLLVNLLLCQEIISDSTEEEESDSDFGANLVATMRNDANLDLSADEDYEDLRAELLAYHTALASLSSDSQRRSMMSTPCWSLGGICVDYKLCVGFRFLTEVPGCKDKLNVCCFAWNTFKVKDWRHKGIGTLGLPWSEHTEFGGRGVVDVKPGKKKKRNKRKLSQTATTNNNMDKYSALNNGEVKNRAEDLNEFYNDKNYVNHDSIEAYNFQLQANNINNNITETKPMAFILRATK